MSDVKNKQVNIYIDQSAAETALDKLQSKADVLNKRVADLQASGKSATAALAQLDKINPIIQGLTDRISKGWSPTIKEQTALVKQLNNELSNISKSDPAFAAKQEQFKKSTQLLNELKGSTQSQAAANESLAGSFGKIFTRVTEYFSAYAIINTVFSAIKGFVTGSIQEFEKSQEAIDGLKNSLENIGHLDILPTLTKQADDFAAKYKELDSDDITKVFTKLVEYGKLSQNQITSLTDVIINYASKQKITLEDATDVFTKALEGNSKGLKTYGISLTGASTVTERYNIIQDQLGQKLKNSETIFEESAKGIEEGYVQKLKDAEQAVGNFLYSLTGIEKQALQNAVDARHEADEGQALVDQYTELSKKVNQTTEDKKQLQIITSQLVGIFGDSVVSIDKETNSLKLNVSATEDLIKQKLLLANDKAAEVAAKYNKAIEDQKSATDDLTTSQKAYDTLSEHLGKTAQDVTKSMQTFNVATENLNIDDSKLSDADKQLLNLNQTISDSEKKGNDASAAIKEYSKQLNDLGFSAADVDKLFHPKTDPNQPLNPPPPTGLSKGAYDELLKAAQEFNKKIRDLQQGSTDASLTQNQKEIADIKHKYDEIFIAYNELQKKLKGSNIKLQFSTGDIQNLESSEIEGTIKKQQAAQQLKTDEDEYASQLSVTANYFAALKQQYAQRFVDGLDDEKIYQANVTQADADAQAQQIRNANDYAATVKQAAIDVTTFQKTELDKQVQGSLAAYKQKKDFEQSLLELEKKVNESNTQTGINRASFLGPQKQADAAKKQIQQQLQDKIIELQKEEDLEVTAANGNQQKIFEIHEKYLQLISNAEEDAAQQSYQVQATANQKIIEKYTAYANTVISIFDQISQAQTDKENRALQTQINNDNILKASYQAQLNGKLLTQNEYNIRVAALDAAEAKKKEDLAKKQFDREKKLKIAQALVNAASSIAMIFATVPPVIPGTIFPNPEFPIALAIAAATNAAQIAIIATQKYAQGGLLQGPSHANGGIPIVNKKGVPFAEAEGGEAILSKQTYRNNRIAVDALLNSSMYHGGATVDPVYFRRDYRPIAASSITQTYQTLKFASGGILPGTSNNNVAASATDTSLVETLQQSKAINIQLMQTVFDLKEQLKKPIKGDWSLKQLDDAQDQRARIRADASFNGS